MQLKKEVIDKIRDLAKNLHDDDLKTFDFMKDDYGNIIEHLTDPRRIELEKMIDQLPKDQQAELLATVMLGREPESTVEKNWWDILDEARGLCEKMKIGEYLAGKGPLTDYIDRGLRKIAKIFPDAKA